MGKRYRIVEQLGKIVVQRWESGGWRTLRRPGIAGPCTGSPYTFPTLDAAEDAVDRLLGNDKVTVLRTYD